MPTRSVGNYCVANLTNGYDSVSGNALTNDAAGNLMKDKAGYQCQSDYEKRIAEVFESKKDSVSNYLRCSPQDTINFFIVVLDAAFVLLFVIHRLLLTAGV